MASLVQDKGGNYLATFRWGGVQYKRSIETRDANVAAMSLAKIEDTLMRLKKGWLVVPEGAEPGVFIASGGALSEKADASASASAPPLRIGELFDRYVSDMPVGAKQKSTKLTEKIHRTHLVRILGRTRR